MREVYSEATQRSSPTVRKCDALLHHFLPSTGSWYPRGHCQDLLFLVRSVLFSMRSPWLRRWCLMGAPNTPGPLNTLAGKIPEHTTDSSLSTSPACLQKETNVDRKMITTQISSWSWVRTKGILVTKQPELESRCEPHPLTLQGHDTFSGCSRASLCIWICLEQWTMQITWFPTWINTLEYSSQLRFRKIYIQLVPQGSFKEQNPPKMREIYSPKKSPQSNFLIYVMIKIFHGYSFKVSVLVESSRQCGQLISHPLKWDSNPRCMTMYRTTAPQKHSPREELGIILQSILSYNMSLHWHHLPPAPFTHHPPAFFCPSLCFFLPWLCTHSVEQRRNQLRERQSEPSWTRQLATSAVELSQTRKASSCGCPSSSDHPPWLNSCFSDQE